MNKSDLLESTRSLDSSQGISGVVSHISSLLPPPALLSVYKSIRVYNNDTLCEKVFHLDNLPAHIEYKIPTTYDNQSYMLISFTLMGETTKNYELLVKNIPHNLAKEEIVLIVIHVDYSDFYIHGSVMSVPGGPVWKAVATDDLAVQ